MMRFVLIISAITFISCDRHEWEGEDGTSQLFESHGGHDSHGSNGDSHGKHDAGDHKKEEKGHH